MDGTSKFELSKQIIGKYLDSLITANSNVETAVRVFGHQYASAAKNCQDTNLEIPFGKNTSKSIKSRLDQITPQGWTAITYALEQAAKDFPEEKNIKNAIVLITDGIETCGGDPCAVAASFQQRRIVLKPHIIGLNIPEANLNYFDCAGKFYDVTNAETFNDAMSTVITQSLNATTAQVNLINQFGRASETNLEISMYDNYSGAMLYNFVHALNDQGVSDTLTLNPAGKYDLVVYSVPPVSKKDVELVAGTHNIIAVDVPQGSLKLTESGTYKRETPLQCVIREKGKKEILMVQDFNTTRKYLIGKYHLEILTLPRIRMQDIDITQGTVKDISVESPGLLTLMSLTGGIASVYVENENTLERIYEFKKVLAKETLLLQPGKYVLVYRRNDKMNSSFTRTIDFEIISGQAKTLNL